MVDQTCVPWGIVVSLFTEDARSQTQNLQEEVAPGKLKSRAYIFIMEKLSSDEAKKIRKSCNEGLAIADNFYCATRKQNNDAGNQNQHPFFINKIE